MKLLGLILVSHIFCQTILYFSGNNAMQYLEDQCKIGPRYPGSVGHEESIKLYKSHFDKYLDNTILFEDYVIHPHSLESIKLTNIFSRFNLKSEVRILLMAHYDTREYADKDLDKNNYSKPIIGANDGASGVAVLMEIAKLLSENSFDNIGVDILLTDGEDMGKPGDPDSWALGAKVVANQLPNPQPFAAICIDMIGDKELNLPIEQNSYRQAPQLALSIWTLAHELGFNQFKMEMGNAIVDDHYAFYNETGIPSIDIIDFHYPNLDTNYWHTLADTPDKCSPESLEAVGTVLINYLYRLDAELYGK